MTEQAALTATPQHPSLVARFAGRFGVEPSKLMSTLKATAFKSDKEITNEQFMALLIVAEKYNLSPFTREIFAFPDKGGIVPVVSIDGWIRIVQEHPQFDGVEFVSAPVATLTDLPEWIECTMHRKDRSHPTRVREFMAECKRNTVPWNTAPRRMLRHRSFMQCGRICFGFVGIHDEDEAQRIVEINAAPAAGSVADINASIKAPKKPAAIDADFSLDGGVNYAQCREAIERSKTIDELDLASDLVRGAPEQFHEELKALAEKRRSELG